MFVLLGVPSGLREMRTRFEKLDAERSGAERALRGGANHTESLRVNKAIFTNLNVSNLQCLTQNIFVFPPGLIKAGKAALAEAS